jgi:hypothetical protein
MGFSSESEIWNESESGGMWISALAPPAAIAEGLSDSLSNAEHLMNQIKGHLWVEVGRVLVAVIRSLRNLGLPARRNRE